MVILAGNTTKVKFNRHVEGGGNLVHRLRRILNENKDKRVIVVGTTCTGKSTFLKYINSAYDMDNLVFPKLSKEERDYVCQTPWTEEIGRTMIRFVRKYIKLTPGEPVFGTVVIDSDLIVYLKISNELLRQRCTARGVNFKDAKNMQKQIDEEVKKSKTPMVEFFVG